MGIIKTQSIQNSFIIYIGIGLGFITTIYLYPNILSPDQYGLTRLLLSLSFVFSQFAHLGMKNTAIRFFPYFEDMDSQHNGFLFITLFIPLVGYALFCLLLYLGQDIVLGYYEGSSALFIEYFWFLLPLVFGVLYFEVLNSYVRARLDSIPGSVISEIFIRLGSILLLVLFLYNWISFKQFMIGFALKYISQPVLLLAYLFQKGELFLKPQFGYLNSNLLKRMGNYGLFVVLGGMTTLVVNNIDIIMLGSLTSLTDTGIYAIAFYVGSIIIVPQRSIGRIANPLVAKYLKDENLDEINKIYKSSSLNQLVAGSLIFIGIWANLDNLMQILPETYASGRWVVILIGLSKLIDMAAGINGSIILNSEYYRFDFVYTLILVIISVVFNYWLIPLYGIIGAALATALSLLINNTIKGIFVWIKLSMQPLSPKLIPLFGLSATILFLSLQIDQIGNLHLDIAIRSLLILLVFTFGVIQLNISDEVNILWKDIRYKYLPF